MFSQLQTLKHLDKKTLHQTKLGTLKQVQITVTNQLTEAILYTKIHKEGSEMPPIVPGIT